MTKYSSNFVVMINASISYQFLCGQWALWKWVNCVNREKTEFVIIFRWPKNEKRCVWLQWSQSNSDKRRILPNCRGCFLIIIKSLKWNEYVRECNKFSVISTSVKYFFQHVFRVFNYLLHTRSGVVLLVIKRMLKITMWLFIHFVIQVWKWL